MEGEDMRKQLRSGAFASVVAIAFAIATPVSAAPKRVIVDGSDTTSDVRGCGSYANPCNTIQAGIDRASSGDTVRVKRGTYAGAIVNKAVALRADGRVIIDSGPYSHAGELQAGFLFEADGSGSGASIEGFRFVGTTQFGDDDGKLDFGIFSRGADDVYVARNSLTNTLQAISNNNGSGWTIEQNRITDLWTRCGSGIGIIVLGDDDVTAVTGNNVWYNEVGGTVFVSPVDCGGYDAAGILLFADFRSGAPGAPSISGNVFVYNRVSLVSNAPAVVNVDGIALTVAVEAPSAPTAITRNLFAQNHAIKNSGDGIEVSQGSSGNTIANNLFIYNRETDADDESFGTRTAGTANRWTGNRCRFSTPPGLCRY
jgi:nitrous oxidase accessory protein NosD